MSDPFRKVKGVYFDVGGTLLYPYPSVGEIYAFVLRRWGVDLPAETLEKAFRATWKKMTHEVKNFVSEKSEKEWWRRLVRQTLQGETLPADFDRFFDDLYGTFACVEHWKLFDGAIDCLRILKRAGYKTGIISNWDHRLRKILLETQLLNEVDEVIISSEVGLEKPDPAIFLEGARRWNFPADELLYVGDSYYHDIEPSQKLGWAAVLIHQHEAVPSNTRVVRDHAEVVSLLGANEKK